MMKTPQSSFVSDKALAVGVRAIKPAASALPLTARLSHVLVSRKALAAGSSVGLTDRIAQMIGELSQ